MGHHKNLRVGQFLKLPGDSYNILIEITAVRPNNRYSIVIYAHGTYFEWFNESINDDWEIVEM